ncbi:hypothetical protein halTADL_2290 [Halohasta litchfieldiae]|jgi:hypothetical protein|uniref:Uncharacterized protein n=1 Tax=Halohasta litchfieldiae TaxID=1073996 RepID=A0A1H6U813_9EURY|nr:hypothetical protein [Halohasta litchfieldiae]ATW89037.1 hypothetical protein halTADL_2290 [Halohasta litchfieldiae]SEI88518.1 hypothetical protein SAMN05444271_11090 [Halohasta litchfieldiae]
MNARQLITITVAALFLIGGATAVGAAAPADQAPDTASDAHAENTDDVDSDTDSEDTANSEAPADAAANVGPSDGLPEQVPDHVSSVLDTIQSFQDGGVDSLGESLSSLVGGGPADNAGESNA